jgi:Glycosyltransferase sugar-binding region containing DXD motif
MAIPNIAHFVWGLKPEPEPFHLVHYLCVESCRQVQRPDEIVLHCLNRPTGGYWQLLEPHVTLAAAALVPEVSAAPTDERLVPDRYRYAHHADFVRLDALIETGGFYADIDTLFVQPFPPALLEASFVLGREGEVRDELTGRVRPSLGNALLLGRPRSAFAQVWRRAAASAMNGTWSNHSTLLPFELSERMPAAVHVEPRRSFYRYGPNRDDLRLLLEELDRDTTGIYTIHLWAHLWWEAARRDFSPVHAGQITEDSVRGADTTYNVLARAFLPA